MKRILCSALLICGSLTLGDGRTEPGAAQAVKPFVRGSIKQIVTAHQGQPFILAFWSLACPPCREELPLLGDFVKRYPGIPLVLISTDSPQEHAAIDATLRQHSLDRAESWVFADTPVERLRYEVDRKWWGELPRTYFHGAGNEVRSVSGKLDLQHLEQWAKAQTANL